MHNAKDKKGKLGDSLPRHYLSKQNGFLNEINRNKLLYIMTFPGMIYLFLFAYLPMVGIYMAFTDYNIVDGIFGSRFVWFDNFTFFLTAGDRAFRATANT